MELPRGYAFRHRLQAESSCDMIGLTSHRTGHGRDSLPPGPRLSAVWQLLRYTQNPLAFLERCARACGTPFTMRMAGFGTLVMLTDGEAIKDVFRGDPHVLHSGEGNEFLALSVGRNSLIVLDDEPHARQRRV